MNPELVSVFPRALSSDLDTSADQKRGADPHFSVKSLSRRLATEQMPTPEDVSVIATTHSADEILLEELIEGNRDALAILFRRYARIVRSVAYRILRDTAEADELLQEVFLFLFQKGTLFDSERGSARSWIVQVTYHRAIDRRRYLASRHFYSQVELDDDATLGEASRTEIAFYEQSMEGILGKKMLERLERSLSEDQRRVLQLYFYEGYTLNEIARDMAQTAGNVRNHYYRGLEKMRRHIFEGKLQAK